MEEKRLIGNNESSFIKLLYYFKEEFKNEF